MAATSMAAPMISSPLKQTNEVDWITPLKKYIRNTYGDEPERYAEECNTLNRLRQDMRGAGKDSASGRDLLYRYYGQLELLDLRFPVDESHIKIFFTWFDAFTHKPTSQHSLAFEKASIIFNISAVLSCHAAVQNRHEDGGLKTAYHSFQASAGMFTYINENFLHAPSTDLNHETVRSLISIMLAQAQEVFLEKQIADGKKAGMLAKLASQAAHLHVQAIEGIQEGVTKAVFERVWLLLTQIKASYIFALAQYYQALADAEANAHGSAIARLMFSEKLVKEASRIANTFPNSPPANANLSSETGPALVEMCKKHLTVVQEKTIEFIKDNDFIYHQSIPNEAALIAPAKLPAAKAIPVGELYQGQDIAKIIGPDIFSKIVPMSVTESASLYDEEKAKLTRAEGERVETAEAEMTTSLDYLKLPHSLNILKGGMDQDLAVDEEFRRWCDEMTGQAPFAHSFKGLISKKERIMGILAQCSKKLDMEESVCEKMRSKHAGDWTQQPSARLTSTLRNDIKNYHAAVEEASTSDAQLSNTLRQYETSFDEMRIAGEQDEADMLYQRAMEQAGASRARGKSVGSPGYEEGNLLDDDFEDGSDSVADKISQVEDLLRKLNLVKRERAQTLKDLKVKVHNDDISQVLILNKKAITNQEHQVFKTELEKFRPYQTRILQATHKQQSILKELTKTYSDLLQDKRVRSEQSKYEAFSRQRGSVMTKYRRVFQSFDDLHAGLQRAQNFYSEMNDTVDSLSQNVESFLSNRRAEGGELLSQIEQGKKSGNVDRDRLTELMSRMDTGSGQPLAPVQPSMQYGSSRPPVQSPPSGLGYNPGSYGTVSPPPSLQSFAPSRHPSGPTSPPAGYIPPPAPPRPPVQHGYSGSSASSQQQPSSQSQDPWAGLNSWR